MGRWGEPEEIAAGIAFLVSEPASFIAGAVLAIDGALSVQFPYCAVQRRADTYVICKGDRCAVAGVR